MITKVFLGIACVAFGIAAYLSGGYVALAWIVGIEAIAAAVTAFISSLPPDDNVDAGRGW